MPRYWGPWTDVAGGGNLQRFRLGMDWSRSGTRVTVDQYLFEAAYSIYKNITLTRTGRLSGSYSVAVSTSGGVVSLGRGGSVTGSRGGSVTIGGRATNVLHGLVPSFSHTISIPAVAPSAPGRPSVSNITSNGFRAAWSAPSNNGGASISRYQLQIATDSSFNNVVATINPGTTRSYTTSARSANTTYWVRVRALNSAGWGPWSSSRSVTTNPLRPNTPSVSQPQRHSDDAHTVSWSQSITNARPVTRFRVQRRVWGTSESWGNWVTRATVSSSTRSYRDTTRNNRTYQWRVVAENSAGSATSSRTDSVWTTPWVPTDVSAQSTSAGVRLRWRDATTSGYADFQIERREDGGSWGNRVTHSGGSYDSTHSWTLSNPNLAVTHQFRIRSRNTSASPTLYSAWVTSNVVQLAAPPSAPTNLGPSGVWDASEDRTLTWRHVPTDGSGQERFQVRHRLQGGSWTTESAVASESEQWTLPGGTYSPGDAIEWQVRTWGVHPDPGPYSASNFQEPTSRPTVAINEPVGGSEIDTSSVLVTWGYSGPDQDDGDEGEISGQAAWRLTVLRGSNVVTEESGSDDRDEFLVRGLSDDATYTIRVEVRSGEGLWSAEADEVTISVSYLPPPPPQIGVAFDRDLGAAVVDVQVAAPHEPYEYVNVVTNPRGRDTDGTVTLARNLALNPRARVEGADAGVLVGVFADREFVDAPVPSPAGLTTAVRYTTVAHTSSPQVAVIVNLIDRPFGAPDLERTVRCAVMVDRPGLVAGPDHEALTPLPANEWAMFEAHFTGPAGLVVMTEDGSDAEVGTQVWVTEIMSVEGEESPGPYGDGDTEHPDPGLTWQWDGDEHESTSSLVAPAPVGWTGDGIWWSAEHDAVYVPQGTEATVPTAALPETVTLVLLDAETGETTQHWDRSDATIPADTVGRYLRAAIVEGAQFTGPYFDGDYPRGPGQDGSLATYTWDGEPHDSATTATITSLETESVQLWRAIDDGPWLLIADEVPPDTAISDPIPAIGERRTNHYRVTAISAIGSAMHSDEYELVIPTHGEGGNHGWVYVNGGTDFSDVVKVRANATRSGSQGLAKGVRRYAGNPRAQERSGTAEHRTWSIGVNARETLYEDGASRPEDIHDLQVSGGVVCYRDPKGARWFGSMGMMDDSYRGITGEVSWPMEEVDQPEGLASEARDQSHGDEDDDDGGEPV